MNNQQNFKKHKGYYEDKTKDIDGKKLKITMTNRNIIYFLYINIFKKFII